MPFPTSSPASPSMMNRDRLDQPPPAPVDQAGATAGLSGSPVTGPPSSAGPSGVLAGLVGSVNTPAAAVGGFVEQAAQLDQAILALAQAAPMMGPKLGQARELIKQAVAEFLQASMMGPEPAGAGFPGGGMGSY